MSDAEQGQFAALLAEATRGPAARRSDWLPAVDTGLCGRLEACTVCGRRDEALLQTEVQALARRWQRYEAQGRRLWQSLEERAGVRDPA